MLKRHPEALWTEMGQQLAVLSMVSGRYFEVQGAGAAIWRWLEHPCQPDDLVGRLTTQFMVDADRARDDTNRFLNQLREAGLLIDAALTPAG